MELCRSFIIDSDAYEDLECGCSMKTAEEGVVRPVLALVAARYILFRDGDAVLLSLFDCEYFVVNLTHCY